MKKENGILIEVTQEDLELLKTNPKEFWAGVSSIGSGAFYKLPIEEIEVPDTVKTICRNAFARSGLKKITLPAHLEQIDSYAFADCKQLDEITLPEGVTVKEYAFEGSRIKTVNIPKRVDLEPHSLAGCEIDEMNISHDEGWTRKFGVDTKINKLNILADCNGIPFMGMQDFINVKELKFQSPLSVIWSDGFSHLRGLEKVMLPEKLAHLDRQFYNCVDLKEVVLPKSLQAIGESCFSKCFSLEHIELPENLQEIGKEAFRQCQSLKDVKIPEGVTEIKDYTFAECSNLTEVTLPSTLIEIKSNAFDNCKALTHINLPFGIQKIGNNAFAKTGIKEITIPDTVYKIGVKCFSDCKDLEKVKLSDGITAIPGYCFVRCSKLSEIEIPESVNLISAKAFAQTNISYVKLNNNVRVSFDAFDETPIKYVTLTKDEKIFSSTPQTVKDGITIPYELYSELVRTGKLRDFMQNGTVNAFNNEIKPYLNEIEKLNPYQKKIFYTLAYAMGCFDSEKLRDKSGKELQATRAQKRSSLLVALLNSKALNFEEITEYFYIITTEDTISDDAIKFMSNVNGKEYINISLLKKLEIQYPGIIYKSLTEFDSASKGRYSINPTTNKTEVVPWETAMVKYFLKYAYVDVKPEDEKMAELFHMHGLEQGVFDKGADLMETARERNIPSHILGKELKEKTILEQIESLKAQTSEVLMDCKELIDDLYSKKFTFEYLDKHDPINAIIGLYASCCSTISSEAYGADIAEATIIEQDVQNLVVRDSDGKIVAKGTLYVDRKNGYILINDFEMSEKYRKDEEGRDGYYTSSADSQIAQDRELIFKALMRGVNAFVEEYDRQNPDNPIKQVNVGMGFNRLKEQCERYEKATDLLTAPAEYSFLDADKGQHILYKRDEEKTDKLEK